MKKIDKKYILKIGILLVLILIFIVSYRNNECDKSFHIERLSELASEIKNLGLSKYPYYINFEAFGKLGYATETFYGDFFLIFPALLINVGISIQLVYTITIVTSFILIIISAYFAFKHYFRDKDNSLYYSLIYSFSNFIVFEAVERNALGTSFGYIFVPWIVMSLMNILSENRKKYDWLILGITMAGLIVSHVQTSILIVIGLCIYTACNFKFLLKNPKVLLELLLAAIIAFLIDAFYIVPLLEQTKFQELYFVATPFRFMKNAYANILNLILPNFIWTKIIPSNIIIANNNYANIIQRRWSIPSLFIPIIFMTAYMIKNNKSIREDKTILKTFIISLVSLILVFVPLLGYFKVFSFMQFPWRMMTLVVTFLPIAFSKFDKIKKDTKFYMSVLTIFNIVLYLLTVMICCTNNNEFTKTIGRGEYLPVGVPSEFYGYKYETKYKSEIYKNGYIITSENIDKEMELPVIYYKGYKAYEINEDGAKELNIEKNENGLIKVKDVNSNKVQVIYEGTILQKISKVISIISMYLIIIGICIEKYIGRKEKI